MRKIFRCLVNVFMILLLSGCSVLGPTDNWKNVEIESYGSVKVPESWEFSIVDGFIHFSSEENGDYKSIMVQYRTDESINQYFAEVEELVWIQDENLSNSACITKNKVLYEDGSSKEMFVLCFTGQNSDESTEFVCIDQSISEDTLREIAKSYIVCE